MEEDSGNIVQFHFKPLTAASNSSFLSCISRTSIPPLQLGQGESIPGSFPRVDFYRILIAQPESI
jgi:hypothetical protein